MMVVLAVVMMMMMVVMTAIMTAGKMDMTKMRVAAPHAMPQRGRGKRQHRAQNRNQ